MRVREIAAAPAPVDACEAFADLPGCSLLESVGDHGDLAAWSFLSADPFLTLEAKGRRVRRCGPGASAGEVDADPFDVLESELRRWSTAAAETAGAGERTGGRAGGVAGDGLPPFRGGVIGWLGYDLLHHLERVPPPRFDDLQLPDMRLGFFDWTLAWDHRTGRAWVISTGLPEPDGPGRSMRAAERIEMVLARLGGRGSSARTARSRVQETPTAGPEAPITHPVPGVPGVRSTFSRDRYLEAVARCREYVLAGDVFQVNLSQRLSQPCADAPLALYRRLRAANPAPFAAYLDGGRAAVLSASPE
nr:chorismate-binding protein [Gemmatimonadota bacterium]